MLQLIQGRTWTLEDGTEKFGYIQSRPKILFNDFDHLMDNCADELAKQSKAFRENCFFTLAHMKGAEDSVQAIRSAPYLDYQEVLAFDIDGGGAPSSEECLQYAAIAAGMLTLAPDDLTVVSSGNGVHLYVKLKHPLRSKTQFDAWKPSYNLLCKLLDQEFAARGMPGHCDRVIFEPARVLRAPGSTNSKPGRAPRECKIIQRGPVAQFDLDLRALSGLKDAEEKNVLPIEVKRKYPTPDFPAVISGCEFLKAAIAHPEANHEPALFDAFSLLNAMPPDASATIGGSAFRPEELARYLFDGASASDSIKRIKFETKWQNSQNYGARKCESIHQRWGKCHTCPYYGKIATPLAIKSKEHIASAGTGYWILSKEGKHIEPAFVDLCKLFDEEAPFVVQTTGQVMAYRELRYERLEDLEVKAWLNTVVNPLDPLKERHRNEFLGHVRARGLNPKGKWDARVAKKQGLIPFQNGLLDVATGKLLEHSPDYGFTYCLPHVYEPDAESEYFAGWLSQMLAGDADLIQTVLDMMSYTLWPRGDDHSLMFLWGDGGNGKSTLLDVLEAVLGMDNCTGLSIEQLITNRFCLAELEGKAANLCREASGGSFSSSDLNILKSLSEEGRIMVERKGEQGYMIKNTAKMIFSLNKAPYLKEDSYALERRVIAVPFHFKIEEAEKDPGVGRRLTGEEVPGVAAMLVRNLRANLDKNNGNFRISRVGATLQAAKEALLDGNNSAVQWFKEFMVEDPTAVAPINLAYHHYRAWAQRAGIQHVQALLGFTISVRRKLGMSAGRAPRQRVDGEQVRIFEGCRLAVPSDAHINAELKSAKPDWRDKD